VTTHDNIIIQHIYIKMECFTMVEKLLPKASAPAQNVPFLTPWHFSSNSVGTNTTILQAFVRFCSSFIARSHSTDQLWQEIYTGCCRTQFFENINHSCQKSLCRGSMHIFPHTLLLLVLPLLLRLGKLLRPMLPFVMLSCSQLQLAKILVHHPVQ